MRAKRNLLGLVLLGAVLTACGGQTFTKQVTEVRVSYAQIWDDRMIGYRDELSAAGVPAKIATDPKTKATLPPAARDFGDAADPQAPVLGRFDTLVAFKAFRFAQPVMSVAQKWVVEQWQTHLESLGQSGVREEVAAERMRALVAGEPVGTVGNAEADFRFGAMAEIRLLVSELEAFNRNYHAALRSDIANLPPQTPAPTAAEMQGIIQGVISGARIGAGLGR